MINQYVSLYVPSTKDIDKPLNPAERIVLTGSVVYKFSKEFGGCTSQNISGAWLNPDNNKVIYEDITIVKSFTDNPDRLAIVRTEAIRIKAEYSQASITKVTPVNLRDV
jgi:hypothetical protein